MKAEMEKEIAGFESKCQKLNVLKKYKMITDEEYDKLKQKLVNELQLAQK